MNNTNLVYGHYCRCGDCARYTSLGYWMSFGNGVTKEEAQRRILEHVRTTHPRIYHRDYQINTESNA